MSEHWRASATGRGPRTTRYLGEDENGDLFVPSRVRANWWDRRFSRWNPAHWTYWLRSRLMLNVVMIEKGLDD